MFLRVEKGGSNSQIVRVLSALLSCLLLLAVVYMIGSYSSPPRFSSLGHTPIFSGNNKDQWVETLSWSPRVFLYHNLLSKDEAAHIVNLASPKVERSSVVGPDGRPVVDDYRSSSGVFVTGDLYSDPLFAEVEKRIADWTHIPPENGEAFYILRYEVGQQYKPHNDYFDEANAGQMQHQIGPSGNRIATVIVCLQAPEEGGETAFPDIGIEVKCTTGNAVLFWDFTPDGHPDPRSLHAGLPVTKGTKWAMTKWIRPRKFGFW